MKKSILFLLLFFTGFTSNAQFLAKMFVKNHNNIFRPSILVSTEKNREIVMLGMTHVGEQSFYDKIKHKVDSLRNEGFIVFYEGVKIKSENDTLNDDLFLRKFRKLSNDALYQSNPDKEKKNFKGLVYQEKSDIGIKKGDFRNDATIKELVQKYEKQFGEVELKTCDFETNFNQKYKCGKVDKRITNYLVNTLREKIMIENLLNYPEDKIVFVIGQGHVPTFAHILKENGYEYKHWLNAKK